jgi:hypothetical protein
MFIERRAFEKYVSERSETVNFASFGQKGRNLKYYKHSAASAAEDNAKHFTFAMFLLNFPLCRSVRRVINQSNGRTIRGDRSVPSVAS